MAPGPRRARRTAPGGGAAAPGGTAAGVDSAAAPGAPGAASPRRAAAAGDVGPGLPGALIWGTWIGLGRVGGRMDEILKRDGLAILGHPRRPTARNGVPGGWLVTPCHGHLECTLQAHPKEGGCKLLCTWNPNESSFVADLAPAEDIPRLTTAPPPPKPMTEEEAEKAHSAGETTWMIGNP